MSNLLTKGAAVVGKLLAKGIITAPDITTLSATITVGTEATDVINVAVQLYDGAGVAVAVRKALPPGAYVEGVEFDEKEGVALTWDHPGLTTPFTFPVEFPLASLQSGSVPNGVRGNLSPVAAPPAAAEPVAAEPEAVKTESVDKKAKRTR